MGRIKVLHVIGGGEFGGAEQHLLTLFRHINRQEFELHVACLFPKPLAPLVMNEGFKVHVFPMRNKFDLQPITKMASLIDTENFDIVHTHGVRANLIGRLAAKRAGVNRVVTTIHSVLAFDYKRRIDRWVNKFCEQTTRKITTRFITVSEKLALQLIADGIPSDKIVTIHNGLEIENYNPELSGKPVRDEFKIDDGTVLIGIVARLHPVKGHSYLLEATAHAVRKTPQLNLLVVGDGPEGAELEAMARRLGIEDKVIFAGFRSDIPEIIAALDFLVLPSLSEGLSLTVMEGMAMKKPVFATAVGGTPEIITSGVDGLLAPPGDVPALVQGIRDLAGDRQFAAKLGVEARKTIEDRFTAELMADRTSQLYKEINKGGTV